MSETALLAPASTKRVLGDLKKSRNQHEGELLSSGIGGEQVKVLWDAFAPDVRIVVDGYWQDQNPELREKYFKKIKSIESKGPIARNEITETFALAEEISRATNVPSQIAEIDLWYRALHGLKSDALEDLTKYQSFKLEHITSFYQKSNWVPDWLFGVRKVREYIHVTMLYDYFTLVGRNFSNAMEINQVLGKIFALERDPLRFQKKKFCEETASDQMEFFRGLYNDALKAVEKLKTPDWPEYTHFDRKSGTFVIREPFPLDRVKEMGNL